MLLLVSSECLHLSRGFNLSTLEEHRKQPPEERSFKEKNAVKRDISPTPPHPGGGIYIPWHQAGTWTGRIP